MSDADALVAGLRTLAAGSSVESPESTDVAPYQTGTIRCDDCKRMWMEDRGERVALSATAAERIACDEQNIGALDGSTPARATQTIPPATRRLVRRRSAGACEVPGCRHRFGLEIHHLTMRSDFGTHDLDNLVDLCGIHHGRFHEGLLLIEGKPSTGLRFAHADGTPYGHAVRPETVQNRADAFSALQNMGYREGDVRAALAQIDAGAEATLGELVKRALKVLSPGAATAPAKSYVMRAGDGSGVVREAEAAWWWGETGQAHVGSTRYESSPRGASA